MGRTVLIASVLLSVLACMAELEVLPNTIILCERDTECPSGYRCIDELGRCLPSGASDAAPTIDGELLVAPNPARHGVVVAIEFTTTLALAENPVVRVMWPTRQREATFGSAIGASHSYSFAPDEAGDPEESAAIDVEMVSESGIVNTAHFPDALHIDFTPPAVVPTTASTRITPSAANPLRDDPLRPATAATDGTLVTVFFAVDEPLAGDPVVRSSLQPDVTFSVVAPVVGSFYTFERVIDAAVNEGSHPIEIVATDLAGNTATITLADGDGDLPVAVDRSAPPSPDTTTPGRMVYTRVPWGSAAVTEPTFMLTGHHDAVAANATVIVYDGREVASATEIGRVSADDDGAFGGPLGSASMFLLNRADRRDVFAVAVDEAGNRSDANAGTPGVQATLIPEVRWIAALAKKIAGSQWENPHRFEARPTLASYLSQSTEAGVSEVGAFEVGAPDAQAVQTRGAGRWRFFEGTVWPRTEDVKVMATDTGRGRLVVLGLQDDGARTWEFDGSRWSLVANEGPSLRFGHAMAFDAGRARMVLFGGGLEGGCGYDSLMFCGDTWEWDGLAWRRVAQTGPEPRGMHAMAYDPVSRRVILFGGLDFELDGDTPVLINFTETWAWDGSAWERVATAGPSGRSGHVLATNAATRSVIMTSGVGSYFDSSADCDEAGQPYCTFTWEWTGSAWQVLTPTAPWQRSFPAAAYDPQRRAMVLHGGRYDPGSASCDHGTTELDDNCYYSDTWELVDRTWSQVSTTGPGPRWQASIGYDATGGRTTLLAGESPSGSGCTDSSGNRCGDMWQWDGSTWTEVLRSTPPLRRNLGLAYHEAAGVTVLFGGFHGTNCPSAFTCDDTWTRDLSGWTQVTSGPSPRYTHSLAYDSVRRQLVMFGGRSNGGTCDGGATSMCETTWTWSPSGWSESMAAAPTPRQHADMAFDRARGELILFGGLHGSDCGEGEAGDLARLCGWTWAWNGSTWSRRCNTSPCSNNVPPARYEHALAFDANRGVVVLFGGKCTFASDDYCLPETWEWDGTSWQQHCTTSPCTDEMPIRRSHHAMVYDQARKRVLLLGGDYGEAGGCQEGAGWPCGFTWEWDGTSWHVAADSGPFMDRESYELAFDTARKTATTLVGETEFATWDWRGGAEDAPGHVMFANFAASGEDPNVITPLSLEVRWDGGGTGFDASGTAQVGARLQLWDGGSWLAVATDGHASVSSPQQIEWSTATDNAWNGLSAAQLSARLRNLFVGQSQTVHVALTPMAPNGPGGLADPQNPYGSLVSDYLEVIIEYRK
jgi:hypothetical protein